MDFEQRKSQEEFYKEFSEKVNDKVISLEMVSLEATPTVFNELNLERTSLAKELWGLFVICSKNIYFYVHPYENPISSMLRQASHAKPPKEQILNISEINSVSFSKIPRKWYDFSFLSGIGKICMEYTSKDGNKRYVFITTQNKAEVVLQKLNSVLALGK